MLRLFVLLAVLLGVAVDAEAGLLRRRGKSKERTKIVQKLGGCRSCR